MSMSIHVTGVREPTEDYLKKLAAYRACEEAGVSPPKELSDYFDGMDPSRVPEDGIDVDLWRSPAVEGNVMDGDEGMTVHLDKLPAGVTRLRIQASY